MAFNTRLQFDWLGRSDELTRQAIQGVQFRESIAAGDRRNQLQREVSQARNLLEFRRQQIAEDQFNRRFEIDSARARAYNRQVELLGDKMKREEDEAAKLAVSEKSFQKWVQEKFSQAKTRNAVATLVPPADLHMAHHDQAMGMITTRLRQLNESDAAQSDEVAYSNAQQTFTGLDLAGQGAASAARSRAEFISIVSKEAGRQGVRERAAENVNLNREALRQKREEARLGVQRRIVTEADDTTITDTGPASLLRIPESESEDATTLKVGGPPILDWKPGGLR